MGDAGATFTSKAVPVDGLGDLNDACKLSSNYSVHY